MTSRKKSPEPGASQGGVVRQWLAKGKRPVRGKGGQGRKGDIGRFLRREAEDIHHLREEEGLTWDDIAEAAATANVSKEDGSPYPGGSFSAAWGRLIERGEIRIVKSAPVVLGDAQAIPEGVPAQGHTRNSPAVKGQAGGMGTGGLQPPVPQTLPPSPPRTGTSEPGSAPPVIPRANEMPRVKRPWEKD
jgi:hypothetical protein